MTPTDAFKKSLGGAITDHSALAGAGTKILANCIENVGQPKEYERSRYGLQEEILRGGEAG